MEVNFNMESIIDKLGETGIAITFLIPAIRTFQEILVHIMT